VAGYVPTAPQTSPESPPEPQEQAPTEEPTVSYTPEEMSAVYENQARALYQAMVDWMLQHARVCYFSTTGGWCSDCKWVFDALKAERGIGVVPTVLPIDPPEVRNAAEGVEFGEEKRV
jgi:hypothetical protein